MVDVMWTPTGRCTACVTLPRSEDPSAHTTLARTQRAYGQSPALAALARAADAVMQPLLARDPVEPAYTHESLAWRFVWGGTTPVRWACTLRHGGGKVHTSRYHIHPLTHTLERVAALLSLVDTPLVLWSTPAGGVLAPDDPILALLLAEATAQGAGRTLEGTQQRLRAWRTLVWKHANGRHDRLSAATLAQADALLEAVWPEGNGGTA